MATGSPGLTVLCDWGFSPGPGSLGLHRFFQRRGLLTAAPTETTPGAFPFHLLLPPSLCSFLPSPHSLSALKVLRKRRAGVKNLKLPEMDSENTMHK